MLKMKKNNIPNLIARFKSLEKKRFSVGYFAEQGYHSSGLTYAGLFAIQSFGSSSAGIVARPILDDTIAIYEPLQTNLMLRKQLKVYFSNISSKTPKISVTTLLSKVAGDYVQKTREGFGDISKLASNTPFTQFLKAQAGVKPNNPLIWTGDLRDNLSYRVNGQAIVTP
jgi:hypothetical protein